MWKKIVCKICGQEIPSPGIKHHLEWHKTEKPCGFCGKPVYGGKKFCNNVCAAKFNNNRKGTGIERRCVCGKRVRSKYCSIECQNNHEYEEYIKKWLDGNVSGGCRGEKGKVSNHVRRWLFERAGCKCEALLDNGSRCGWSRKNPKTGKIPLTVHHKDGNSEHHVPKNLELICPCCHSLTPTYGGGNKGNGRRGRKN
jgi:hypothetical protein